MNPYIEISHITKKFGEETILHDIDIVMEQGKTYGFSGNNGSGKTVLMKCICGFLPATSGIIKVGGKRIGAEIDFPESIGVIIETPGFLPNLTGFQNLKILADLKNQITEKEISRAGSRFEKIGIPVLFGYAAASGYCPGDYGRPRVFNIR